MPSVAWSKDVLWSVNFLEAGVDQTTSLGQFGIKLTREWGKKLGVSDNCPEAPECLFMSPVLIDPNTQIGRSDPHEDSDDPNSTDKKGASICDASGPGGQACSHFSAIPVKDGDLTLPISPTVKFQEGPNGTREIHTQVLSFNMNHWKSQKRCDAAFSANSVKAGSAAPARDRSIGEVEAKTTNGDFPAESFFNVFVEVDVDWDKDGTRDLIVYNKSPLIIQNSNLNSLPPRVVYVHNGSENAPAVYDTVTGTPVGWITIAGHGFGYDCSSIDEFKEVMEDQPHLTKLEPILTAGVDVTRSLGRYKIRLTQEAGKEHFGFDDCPHADRCLLVSSVLSDRNTKIGRSNPHLDGDNIDTTHGAKVCKEAGTPNNGDCTAFFTDTVKDSDFSFVPDNLFHEGPIGTKEVHTQIISFNMTNPSQSKCGPPSKTAIRAGSEYSVQPRSIGEIEFGTNNFPAESFFNIFVEVDIELPSGAITTLFNKAPLVIQNDSLDRLPPYVVYTHEESGNIAPLVYVKSTSRPFGWLTLAGHGVSYDCSQVEQFTAIIDKMEENLNLEPIKLTVDPFHFDFGDVTVGSSATQLFTLSNRGDVPLDIGTIKAVDGIKAVDEFGNEGTSQEFIIDGDNCSGKKLSSAAECEFSTEFTPQSEEEKKATVFVPYFDELGNPGTPLTVPLQGNGIPPRISVEPVSHDFGDVYVGFSVYQTFKVSNVGTTPLKIEEITLLEITMPAESSFSVKKDICSEQILTPASFCFVVIEFKPLSLGEKSANLQIPSDSDTLSVPLKGNGVGICLDPPIVEVKPEPINFGSVPIGSSMSMPVSVYMRAKNCVLQLQIDDITVTGSDEGEFKVVKPLRCKSGTHGSTSYSYCRVKLVFNADEPDGTKDAKLNIVFNDTSTAEKQIDAKAIAPSAVNPQLSVTPPTSHDFGDVFINTSSSPYKFTVKNMGNVLLRIRSHLAKGDVDDFSRRDTSCSRLVNGLHPGDTCSIDAIFNPTQYPGGNKWTDLVIRGTTLYRPPQAVQLTVRLAGMAKEPRACTDLSITTASVRSGRWSSPSTWDNGVPDQNDVVRINAKHTVKAYQPFLKNVKSLCIKPKAELFLSNHRCSPVRIPRLAGINATVLIKNEGTIKSQDGRYALPCAISGGGNQDKVDMNKAELVESMVKQEKVQSSQIIKPWWWQYPGTSIYLLADSTYNYGRIIAGNGISGVRPTNGGNVLIRTRSFFYNTGTIIAGNGGDSSRRRAGHGGYITVHSGRNIFLRKDTPVSRTCGATLGDICAGNGGNLTSRTPRAIAGNGGRIYMRAINSLSAYRTRFNAIGGYGGNCFGPNLGQRGGNASGDIILIARYKRLRHVWLSAGRGGTRCEPGGRNGNDGIVWIDPSDVSISGEDTIIEGGNVTIAGGDNGTIEITELNEGAITATDDLTLAVGENGVIMTDSTDNIMKADGQVNIFADDIMLPEDVNVSDITGDNVVIGSGQIMRDVSIMASGNSSGEQGVTLPFDVALSNNGPETDTYLLTVTDEEGWSLSGLPSTVEIEGHETVELTLDVVLPSTPEATNVITVTAISQSDPTVVTTTEISIAVEAAPESSSVPSSSGTGTVLCPSSGTINRTCNNRNQVMTDTTIETGGNISGGTITGIVDNNGILSQVTIDVAAVVNGGKVSGHVTNNGSLGDFEFVGASLTGGELFGNVTNNSQVGGIFINVRLAANTSIDGGAMQGEISGDASAPATLRNVRVKAGSRLSNVILGEGVQLPEDVEFGEGIRFTDPSNIPDGELMGLLPGLAADAPEGVTHPRRADFSVDILEPSEGILSVINELPLFKDNGWVLSQNKELGYFEVTIDNVRYAEIPFSVTKTTAGADMLVLDAQSLSFITGSGLDVLTNPALQAPSALQTALGELFELSEFTLQANGNLSVPAGEGVWYSARPDWSSLKLDDVPESVGLSLSVSPHVNGASLASLVFADNEEYYRQNLFPSLADPEALAAVAGNISTEAYGLVNFTLNGKAYRGVVDYLVTQTDTTTNTLQVEPIADVNGDGIDDVMLTYPNGEQQIVFVK